MENRSMSDVGGTPGGLGEFVIGLIMACVGGYLLSNQVKVIGSYWDLWGTNSVGGALFILAGVIANMHIYFQPTSLFNTVLMLILLVGGVALIARSTRPHHAAASE